MTMASAYSDDLRRKFFEAYQRGDGSLAVLAGRFGVSVGWAEKLMRTVRQTGRTERPAGKRRGPASKLTPELRETMRGWIQAQPDLTLAELQQRLWTAQEVEVSISRLWTVLGEMGLRLKKSHSTPLSRIRRRPASSAASGGGKRARSTLRS
jgi:transposase